MTMVGMATLSPARVVISASDIPPARVAGLTALWVEITEKTSIMPEMVPRRPSSVLTPAMVPRVSTNRSSPAASWRPASSRCCFMTSRRCADTRSPAASTLATAAGLRPSNSMAAGRSRPATSASVRRTRSAGATRCLRRLNSRSTKMASAVIEHSRIGTMKNPPLPRNSSMSGQYQLFLTSGKGCTR